MSNSSKKPIIHSHLIKQPSFKNSLMVAIVISLGGTSLATWAGENMTTMATSTTTNTPAVMKQTDCNGQFKPSPQARTKRRTEAFQQADTNKDGKVNLTEWLAFKPQHRGPEDRPDANRSENHTEDRSEHRTKNLVAWLQKVDANHDGLISKAEAESYAPRLAEHFAEIDTNHNGLISQDELKASQDARKAKWHEHSIKNRTEAFAKADTNHDGQITLTEWMAFKPHEHHKQHDQRSNLFKKVDTNDDGQISLSEAQANAPRMAEHFNEIDTDHNGLISQDERRAAFKAACAKAQS